MKYLLIIAAMLFAYTAYASDNSFNPVTQSGGINLSTKVYIPMEGSYSLPFDIKSDVIIGQSKDVKIPVTFELTCQTHSNVVVNFYAPTDVTDGGSHVALTGFWCSMDEESTYGTSHVYNLGEDESDISFQYMITKIDATDDAVTPGEKHFEIKVDFAYTGI